MGTVAEIQAYHPDREAAESAIRAALDEMQRVEGLLSNYSPDSELSRMNKTAARAPFAASGEMFDFVKRCRAFFDLTLGTFDPTVGPLVRAWGFHGGRPAPPSAEDAAAAKARSGFDKVRLDEAARTVSYTVEGVELDPGGIGKGYAADRASAVLRRSGITSALVSAGGSTLYAMGRPPGREGWRVGIRDPAAPGAFLRFVTLRDQALSTSGVTEKYAMAGGRRYGHIIDPRTGEPGEAVCQVTLVTADATDSDALTKAAFLLPRETLVELFGKTADVHVFRVEGPCGDGSETWTTPWSRGVFHDAAGMKQPERN
ncbi:MAG: FAD:protein FMN transferase [Vicinamibacterales bacterium]